LEFIVLKNNNAVVKLPKAAASGPKQLSQAEKRLIPFLSTAFSKKSYLKVES